MKFRIDGSLRCANQKVTISNEEIQINKAMIIVGERTIVDY